MKKAPFIVLIGANMPSILAEISFVSNPGDEQSCGPPSTASTSPTRSITASPST